MFPELAALNPSTGFCQVVGGTEGTRVPRGEPDHERFHSRSVVKEKAKVKGAAQGTLDHIVQIQNA